MASTNFERNGFVSIVFGRQRSRRRTHGPTARTNGISRYDRDAGFISTYKMTDQIPLSVFRVVELAAGHGRRRRGGDGPPPRGNGFLGEDDDWDQSQAGTLSRRYEPAMFKARARVDIGKATIEVGGGVTYIPPPPRARPLSRPPRVVGPRNFVVSGVFWSTSKARRGKSTAASLSA